MRILGYLEILAMLAVEIATHCGYGVRAGAGQEMKKGFFFNGIIIAGNQPAVNQGVELAILVFPDPADPSFPRLDLATMITKGTDSFAISGC
jgi:hypothetical protein